MKRHIKPKIGKKGLRVMCHLGTHLEVKRSKVKVARLINASVLYFANGMAKKLKTMQADGQPQNT